MTKAKKTCKSLGVHDIENFPGDATTFTKMSQRRISNWITVKNSFLITGLLITLKIYAKDFGRIMQDLDIQDLENGSRSESSVSSQHLKSL